MLRRSRTPSTALVAAASRPLVDKTATVPRQAAQWQAEAWTMFDEIGEVKYACNLAGNAMAKLRLYVAVREPEEPDADPVPLDAEMAKELGIPPELHLAAQAELARLGSGDGVPELLRSLNINLEVAGELWLVGWDARGPGEAGGPAPERWEARSVSEVNWQGSGEHRTAQVSGPDQGKREVDANRDAIIRVWVRHPRFGELADSNLRGVLADCRALLGLQQQAIAESRSRMGAGAFTVPNELTISPARTRAGADAPPSDDPEADPFLLRLEDAMIDPVEDLTSPSSVAPFVIRGPAEFLQPQYLRRIDLSRQSTDIEARIEARVQRLARGMNLPVEVMLGHQQTTFANAAQVDQDTFEDHFEPRARLLVDTLTNAYLRPGLIDGGHDPAQVARLVVWYDPSLLLASPNTDENADDAFDNQAISWAAYRRAKGFDEADAPGEREQLMRAGLLRGILTADLTAQLLNMLAEPEAEGFPPLVAAPTGGQQAPSGPTEAVAAALAMLATTGELAGLLAVDGATGAAPFRAGGRRDGAGGRHAARPGAAGHRSGVSSETPERG